MTPTPPENTYPGVAASTFEQVQAAFGLLGHSPPVGTPAISPAPDIKTAGLDFILPIRFAFQDFDKLYLASDFCAGGDLLGLLEKFDVFSEVRGLCM